MCKMGDEVYVTAKYDYTAADDQELDIKKNEKLILLDDSRKWWKVQKINSREQAGFVPSNFVKRCKPSILTSLKNTLGRRKGSDVKSSLREQFKNGDTSENSSYGSGETQACDNTPAIAKYAYP